jgi:hypothetical protein
MNLKRSASCAPPILYELKPAATTITTTSSSSSSSTMSTMISIAEQVDAQYGNGGVSYCTSLIDSNKCNSMSAAALVQQQKQFTYDHHQPTLLGPLQVSCKPTTAMFSSQVATTLLPVEIENQPLHLTKTQQQQQQQSINELELNNSDINNSIAFSLNGGMAVHHHLFKTSEAITASDSNEHSNNYCCLINAATTTPQASNCIDLEAKLIEANCNNNNNLLSCTLNTPINSNLLSTNTNNKISQSQQIDNNNNLNINNNNNNNDNSNSANKNSNNSFSDQLNISKLRTNRLGAHQINNFSFQQNLQSNNESWPINHQYQLQQRPQHYQHHQHQHHHHHQQQQQQQKQHQQYQKPIRWSFENQQQYRVNLNLMANSWKELTRNFIHYKPY